VNNYIVGAPQLAGQTVVLIGGSAGIGLETARLARAEGAGVILVGRDRERLDRAACEVGAQSTVAFDATDPASLRGFFQDLAAPIDHVLVTAGRPHYGPLLEMSAGEVRDALSDHIVQGLEVARGAVGKMRAGGSLLLMGGTGSRRVVRGLGIASAATAALPPFVAALALELAPVRVNLIAAGFVDTPLSASLLGDQLEERRNELRATLPIGRVVGPADVAALAVHLMINTALTGATYDIDGGQQFVALWVISSRPRGQRVPGLIDGKLRPVWQADCGQESPALIGDIPGHLNSLAAQLRQGGLDVIAHEVKLVAALALRWVNGELGWGQGEDEPASAGVNRRHAKGVCEERADLLGFRGEHDRVHTGDHPRDPSRLPLTGSGGGRSAASGHLDRFR
jgi:NAD(P)-dependent dehydrogenase (short-subunit alcohol dehydrogenase family)